MANDNVPVANDNVAQSGRVPPDRRGNRAADIERGTQAPADDAVLAIQGMLFVTALLNAGSGTDAYRAASNTHDIDEMLRNEKRDASRSNNAVIEGAIEGVGISAAFGAVLFSIGLILLW